MPFLCTLLHRVDKISNILYDCSCAAAGMQSLILEGITLNIEKQFIKYVFQNILGMLGISAYVLADTFFIAQSAGADGITALNLVLPIYSLIFAIGSMIAAGSATRYKICRAQNTRDYQLYFPNAVFFAILLSMGFVLAGIFIPDKILAFMGGDEEIIRTGTSYTRIFMLFAPFFMLNYIFNAFVRNDNNPSLAMVATFSSSIFNIVMDYVLIFPCHMGMSGAALATALSPIVGISICSLHFFSGRNTIPLVFGRPSLKKLLSSCQLGVSAFVGEISSGVTTMVFNTLILEIAGNIGVAAYGVIANVAMVAVSIFNGISQGGQPLLSDAFGRNEIRSSHRLLRLSIITASAAAALMIFIFNVIPEPITAIFNRENNPEMTAYAVTGMRIYFSGLLFAGFNIVGTGYLSATAQAGWAFATSILRGFAAIIVCALILSRLFGMYGIWLTVPCAELITAIVMVFAIARNFKKNC